MVKIMGAEFGYNKDDRRKIIGLRKIKNDSLDSSELQIKRYFLTCQRRDLPGQIHAYQETK